MRRILKLGDFLEEILHLDLVVEGSGRHGQRGVNRSIIINIDLGLGSAGARGFGCDLTHEYVNVNANYTT